MVVQFVIFFFFDVIPPIRGNAVVTSVSSPPLPKAGLLPPLCISSQLFGLCLVKRKPNQVPPSSGGPALTHAWLFTYSRFWCPSPEPCPCLLTCCVHARLQISALSLLNLPPSLRSFFTFTSTHNHLRNHLWLRVLKHNYLDMCNSRNDLFKIW